MAESSIIGVTRSRLGMSLPLLAGLLAYGLTLAASRGALDDPDILWHIVVGHWIVAHHAVPHADFLSHSMRGAPWVVHEWLAEVIMAWFYDRLGWHGLVVMAGLATGATMALFCRALLRYFEPLHALVLLIGACCVLTPHWLARPHILALPFLIVWMTALVEAREQDRAPPLAMALVIVPWANLHGSFLLGLGFAGLLAGEAVITAPDAAARWQSMRRWAVFLAAAFAASFLTPNGIEAYLLPFHLLRMHFALSIIAEWRSPDFQHFQPLELWILSVFAAMAGLGLRLPVTRLAMVLLLIHMALQHARQGEMLAFIAPLLAGPSIGAQLRRRVSGAGVASLDRIMADLALPARGGAIAAAAVAMLAATLVAARFPVSPDKKFMPVAAVEAVRDHHITGPVLNEYSYGGYLIYAGIPTFIDGRTDMYGDPFIKRDIEAVNGVDDDLPALLKQYGIAWTLFPVHSTAVTLLDHLSGWKRLYADDIAVVHVRSDGPPSAPSDLKPAR